MKKITLKRDTVLAVLFYLGLWALTVLLLYPLMVMDSLDMTNVKTFLFRVVFGISIMIILFGKTVFDLLFPQGSAKKVPLFHTILLTIYSLAIASVVIYFVGRLIILYTRSLESEALMQGI